jgi:putative ABC transport system ATP-binding protein
MTALQGEPHPLLRVRGLSKHYGEVAVFNQVDLDLAPGEFVALLGESGVGKSTLLNCIAGLDDADSGSIVLDGMDIHTASDDERAIMRRSAMGFVFQAFHVLPHLSVAENIGLPLRLLGRHDTQRVQRALDAVGLNGLGQRMPAQLSGGQLQRVAIARAVVHQPRLILADEPTGNLDPDTARRVMDLLLAQVREHQSACLLVTHSPSAAAVADRVLRLTTQGVMSTSASKA